MTDRSLLRGFQVIGIAETTSLILLFFIAMPFKYLLGKPEMVQIVGAVHGGLFVLYMAMVLALVYRFKMDFDRIWIAGVLSMFPLGTLLFEKKYVKIMSTGIPTALNSK